MQELPAKYLSDLASQIGFLSAFLGGFAATMLAMLLALPHKNKAVGASIWLAAAAAVAFIVSVIATTYLFAVLHPDAPANVRHAANGGSRAITFLSFIVGTYALLGCIGVSGWVRSRGTGVVTAILAAVGGVLVTMALISA